MSFVIQQDEERTEAALVDEEGANSCKPDSPDLSVIYTLLASSGENTDLQPMLPAQPAATAVFNVTELQEAILLHLSAKELLSVQSVSRSWQQTMRNSPTIQIALSLRAIEPPEDRCSVIMCSSNPTALIRAKSIFRANESAKPIEVSPEWTPAQELYELYKTGSKLSIIIFSIFSSYEDANGQVFQISSQKIGDVRRGSWEDMSVFQKPLKRIQLVRLPSFMEKERITTTHAQKFRQKKFVGGQWRTYTCVVTEEPRFVENADGVTMAQFMEFLKTQVKDNKILYLSFLGQCKIQLESES